MMFASRAIYVLACIICVAAKREFQVSSHRPPALIVDRAWYKKWGEPEIKRWGFIDGNDIKRATSIGDNAFANSRLTTIDLSYTGVTSIGESAFKNSGLEKITFPASLTSIGKNAFLGNKRLKIIDLRWATDLKNIDHSAFGYSGVELIILPAGFARTHAHSLTHTLLDPDSMEQKVTIAYFLREKYKNPEWFTIQLERTCTLEKKSIQPWEPEGQKETSLYIAYCDAEMLTNQQTRESKAADVEGIKANIEELLADFEKLGDQIKALNNELVDLDAAIAKATADRDSDKAKNTATVRDATVGAQATAQALVVLKDFYNKAAQPVASPAPQQGPIKWDGRSLAILKKIGGSSAGDAKTQKRTGYTGQANGVIGLLEVIQSDFTKLANETQGSEEGAVREYEKFMSDSKESKAVKTQDLKHRTKEKTAKTVAHGELKKNLRIIHEELDAALAYYEKLKPDCETKGPSYEERVEQRKKEIESHPLQEALDVKVDRAWYKKQGEPENIRIPSVATSIGDNAFANSSLITIDLSHTGVTSIGESAFKNSGLEKITFPASLTSIGMGAFLGNERLKVIDLGKATDLKNIDHRAFGYSGVELIILPAGFARKHRDPLTHTLSPESVGLDPDSMEQKVTIAYVVREDNKNPEWFTNQLERTCTLEKKSIQFALYSGKSFIALYSGKSPAIYITKLISKTREVEDFKYGDRNYGRWQS